MSERLRPPTRRLTERTKHKWNRQTVFFDVGRYSNGQPCEVFIDAAKEGTEIKDTMGGFAIVSSLALQYGVPAQVFKDALRGFSPESLPGMLSAVINEPCPYEL